MHRDIQVTCDNGRTSGDISGFFLCCDLLTQTINVFFGLQQPKSSVVSPSKILVAFSRHIQDSNFENLYF